MFPNEKDVVIMLYLLSRGPQSSYQMAKDFLSAGVMEMPEKSGIKGVVRVLDARLQRLMRDGFVSKDENTYAVTSRTYVDRIRVVGEKLEEDLGEMLVLDVNGHFALYDLESLKRIVPEKAWEQLFVGFDI